MGKIIKISKSMTKKKDSYYDQTPTYLKTFFCFIVPLWFMMAPIGMLIWLITLPWKILKIFIYGREAKKDLPMLVKITECTGKNQKDELLFIHGYPDTGKLWNK